jgi:hypothetical protein
MTLYLLPSGLILYAIQTATRRWTPESESNRHSQFRKLASFPLNDLGMVASGRVERPSTGS